MAILLDTHVVIWLEEDPQKIPSNAIDRIYSGEDAYFSLVSIWEMAIKMKTGKLTLRQPLPLFTKNLQQGHYLKLKEISFPHIYHTQLLPLHHKDPFDRLIIAQSLTENIAVISSDAAWDAYGVQRIWN